MTPKELREMAENKALDIGTAWNALEAAAERIETLEADCASLKQRAWRAESRADEKWGLRKELADALCVSDERLIDASPEFAAGYGAAMYDVWRRFPPPGLMREGLTEPELIRLIAFVESCLRTDEC